MLVHQRPIRLLVLVASLAAARSAAAQSQRPAPVTRPPTTADELRFAGACVQVEPNNSAVLTRFQAPRYAKLDSTLHRTDGYALRVARQPGEMENRYTQVFGREGVWRVRGDTLTVRFSTGFVAVWYDVRLAGGDTLSGVVHTFEDDGGVTRDQGGGTVIVVPCGALFVPAPRDWSRAQREPR